MKKNMNGRQGEMRNSFLKAGPMPQRTYIIVCAHLGESFSSREKAMEAIVQLSEETGINKEDFDIIALTWRK